MEFGPNGFILSDRKNNHTAFTHTPWHPVQQIQAAQELTLQLGNPKPLADNESLIVSIGIEMGAPETLSVIRHVKYCGAGKVLVVN